MSSAGFQWDDTRFKALVIDAADVGIGQAAEVIVTQAKQNLGRQGFRKRNRNTGKLTDVARGRAELNKIIGSAAPGTLARTLLARFGRNPETGRLTTRNRRNIGLRKAIDLANIGSDVDPAGGFPRLITGVLRGSIKAGYSGGQPVKGERVVGSTMNPRTEYAAAQEYGSPKLKLPARPYVRPAADMTRAQQVEQFFRAAKAYMDATTR